MFDLVRILVIIAYLLNNTYLVIYQSDECRNFYCILLLLTKHLSYHVKKNLLED